MGNNEELTKQAIEKFNKCHTFCKDNVSKYIKADYTKESIKEIENKILEYKKNHNLSEKDEQLLINTLGIYLGDVILKETNQYDYDWHVIEEYSDEKVLKVLNLTDYPFIANKKANSFFFPIDKVSKCYYNNDEENGDADLLGFYEMVVGDSIGVNFEETNKKNEKMFMPEKLKRSELVKELESCINKDIKSFVLSSIKTIRHSFNWHIFYHDTRFLLLGRKRILIYEINGLLKDNQELNDDQLNYIMNDLKELINEKNEISQEECQKLNIDYIKTTDDNNKYYEEGYICMEEKHLIQDIIIELGKRVK